MGTCASSVDTWKVSRSMSSKSLTRAQSSISLSENMMGHRSGVSLTDYYDIESTIGEGSMGCVARLRKRSTNDLYALKTIQLARISRGMIEELENEILILRSLDHPNIIRAFETFHDGQRIHLIMELCKGGDLYSRNPYTEGQAQKIITQILSAVSYMHAKGIVHRDIKFENIMFSNEVDIDVKLIDFGLGKKFRANSTIKGSVGTLYSMAPEVFSNHYTEACDLWSIGVVAFMLLSSELPFHGKTEECVREKIEAGKYSFEGLRWERVSLEAEHFVRQLLCVDLKYRFTAEQALKHPWISVAIEGGMERPSEAEKLNADFDIVKAKDIVLSMKRFGNYGKLKRAVLMVIAHRYTSHQIQELREMFMNFDIEKNGMISLEELKQALSDERLGLAEKDIESIFKSIAVDSAGRISYTEFLAATVESMGQPALAILTEAFERFDSDNTGHISRDNLREILGKDYSASICKQMMKEGDIKNNGVIDFDEFLQMMLNKKA